MSHARSRPREIELILQVAFSRPQHPFHAIGSLDCLKTGLCVE